MSTQLPGPDGYPCPTPEKPRRATPQEVYNGVTQRGRANQQTKKRMIEDGLKTSKSKELVFKRKQNFYCERRDVSPTAPAA